MTKLSDADVCSASLHLRTGRSDGPWYTTLMPFEHFNSLRSQQFPHSCDAAQLAGRGAVTVQTRDAVGDYPSPYNVVTRERDELFVYGGYVNQGSGAYVAKLDPVTLLEKWRVYMSIPVAEYFDW